MPSLNLNSPNCESTEVGLNVEVTVETQMPDEELFQKLMKSKYAVSYTDRHGLIMKCRFQY